jgi:hypothetical protein
MAHIKEDERLIDQARRHLSAISPDARFPFDGLQHKTTTMKRRLSLYTHQPVAVAYDEYFLLLLSGRSPSMAMMMMTIICLPGLIEYIKTHQRGVGPAAAAALFDSSSSLLIAVTLFPYD